MSESRAAQALRAISLFCGCGGADLGLTGGFDYLGTAYASNPVEIIHASDIDAKAIATYNSNFAHMGQVADVHDVSLARGCAEIVVGGFPCQSFSTVNPTKDPTDHRGQLFWQMARIVETVMPLVFVAENVKGFYLLNRGLYFQTAKAEFERHGYRVAHAVLNAADYGVPQLRQRLFMVGIREDLGLDFDFPRPTNGPQAPLPRVPLGDVIDSLEPDDPKYYFSKRAVEGVKNAKPNMKRALAQDLAEPCLTVTSHLAKVSLNSRDPVLLVSPSDELYRRFTPREAARIQSFPESFEFVGSEADAYRQVGNAIPPVLMWHVINAVLAQLPTNSVCQPEREVAC